MVLTLTPSRGCSVSIQIATPLEFDNQPFSPLRGLHCSATRFEDDEEGSNAMARNVDALALASIVNGHISAVSQAATRFECLLNRKHFTNQNGVIPLFYLGRGVGYRRESERCEDQETYKNPT